MTQVFEGTLRRLVEYSWPGNVRELQNVIERGAILSPSNLLVLDRNSRSPGDEARVATVAESLESIISGASSLPGTSLREAERRHIESALAATNWVTEGERRREDFGAHPNTLRSRVKKLNILRQGDAPTNGEPAHGTKAPC